MTATRWRKETFRLYYTRLSDEQSSFTVWVEDSDGQAVELEYDFNADNDKEDGDGSGTGERVRCRLWRN